jgi:uncharacterized membrane protein YvbJ
LENTDPKEWCNLTFSYNSSLTTENGDMNKSLMDNGNENALSTSDIVVIIVVPLVLVLLTVIIILYFKRRRSSNEELVEAELEDE